MTAASSRRQVGRVVLATIGALMMTFFAATATPQSLPPKPHYLGADPDVSASSGTGVRLSAIKPGSPAEKAGLQAGDVVVKLGAVAIKNPDDLMVALKSTIPGRPAEVTYLRDGKEYHTQVSLEPRR
jgi:S1-C subfamily serine protease